MTFKVVVSTRVKHSDEMQWGGLISSSEGNCARSFVSRERVETGTSTEWTHHRERTLARARVHKPPEQTLQF